MNCYNTVKDTLLTCGANIDTNTFICMKEKNENETKTGKMLKVYTTYSKTFMKYFI